LIDAVTGHHVWAEKFEGELRDIFELQEDVAARVVGSLVPALELSEMGRLTRTHESSQSAYDLFLRARAHTYRGEFRRGIELCYEAIKKDPEFGQAYAAAAIAFSGIQAMQGVPLAPDEKEQAIRLANQGLNLDSNNAAILYRAGQVLATLGKEFERGSILIDQAVALNPNLSDIWFARAAVGLMNGDAERAMESCFQFLRISPMDPIAPWVWSTLSAACFQLGRYDEGCSWGAKAIQQRTAVSALTSFIANAVQANRMDDARRAATRLMDLQPRFCISYAEEITPARSPDVWARARDALRAAGLPD
jgi:tetratricopeptide (TPR) repeat protein